MNASTIPCKFCVKLVLLHSFAVLCTISCAGSQFNVKENYANKTVSSKTMLQTELFTTADEMVRQASCAVYYNDWSSNRFCRLENVLEKYKTVISNNMYWPLCTELTNKLIFVRLNDGLCLNQSTIEVFPVKADDGERLNNILANCKNTQTNRIEKKPFCGYDMNIFSTGGHLHLFAFTDGNANMTALLCVEHFDVLVRTARRGKSLYRGLYKDTNSCVSALQTFHFSNMIGCYPEMLFALDEILRGAGVYDRPILRRVPLGTNAFRDEWVDFNVATSSVDTVGADVN